MLAVLVIATLGLVATVPHGFVERVAATGSLTDFVINAIIFGWNDTNPQVTEYRGVLFTVNAKYSGDLSTHTFAIYTANFPNSSVTPFDSCSLTSTNGCLAHTLPITSTSTSVKLTFNATIPHDDGTGPGVYEYYCQYHPTSMHGKFRILKDPDINGDHAVNFLDLGLIGSAFLSTPATSNLNNDGTVNFLDLGIVGNVFLRTL